ncbi:sodium:sulfate symporter [Halobacillus andaensis]|uniref:Sodium:sulfate symporter n=1 Tax=Halobacillus andaensis TaxID=1176239 RepID=A0A917EXX8_HALAA|nr:SLC13 family permease [Halobacillus andaensis]MBP2004299.1 di/tricarboxylate transporter [Halobacillus andaensis]GGF22717.1 sodium:sulfate symporter [Halobacillus andaensis]
MTYEMIIVIIALLLMLVGLFFEVARPDLLVFSTLFLFILLGFIETDEALVGFSNQGMLTVALLFIVAGVFERSGLVERLISSFLARAKSHKGALSRLIVPVSGFSAFLNNTPIVVTLTPIMRKWASENDVAPSKYLLPLSYASILGGTITLMGTSTNLVIHGLMLDFGMDGFLFFQLAVVGIPITIIGLLYLIFIGPKVLPNHRSLIDKVSESTKDYLSEMVVTGDFPYLNRTVGEADLRNLKGLYLIEIIRSSGKISPVTRKTKIQVGDRLIFTGMISTIADLQKRKGLQLDTGTDLSLDDLKNGSNKLQEIVVSHQSSLLGRSIKQSRFRKRYDAAVMAVHRNDERVEGKIGDIVPKAGDLMLVVTGEEFEEKSQEQKDFYVISPVQHQKFYENESKGWFALILLMSMIALVTFQVLSIFKAMVITAGIMLLTKMITPKQAKQSVQFQVLLLIASALGIGNVIIQTGTAKWIATQLVNGLAPLGVITILIVIYCLTNLFTEFITNNAAAVIMFPIAYEVAIDSGIDPMGIAILVAIAASASFLSPIGYQTNLIVYGPGGYRFKDYIKVGLPLTLLVMVTSVFIIYYQFV